MKILPLLIAPALLALPACAPCRDAEKSPLLKGTKFHSAFVATFGSGQKIPLSATELDRLVQLLGECRECIPNDPPELMISYDHKYVVHFQSGPKPRIEDNGVLFASDRSLVHARCAKPGTKRAIRQLLDKHIDELDAGARRQKTLY